jgi:hypothetical protein
MSCRIDRRVVSEDLVVFCICGQITGEDGTLLRALLENETKNVTLDLENVRLVDRDAVNLLAASETRGIEIRNCPAYVREWINQEKRDTGRGTKR